MTVNAERQGSRPLAGRVAIVTGASSGLGARFATVLADGRRPGRRLRAPARAARGARHARTRRSIPLRCDVTVEDDRGELVATALDRFGRIDVCVNNAGIVVGRAGAAGDARGLPGRSCA